MKGYKAFNNDLTCRGMQYEVGKEYKYDEWTLAEGMEIKEIHGVVEIRIL